MFKPNHNDLPEEQLVKEGNYEVLVVQAIDTCTQSGTPYIGLHVVIRNDVEQAYKNKHLFESLWTSANALPYTTKKLNAIDKACGMTDGAEYDSVNAWGDAIKGKPMLIHVGVQPEKGGYPAKNIIQSFKETKFPEVKHVFANKQTAATTATATATPTQQGFMPVVDDEELPF